MKHIIDEEAFELCAELLVDVNELHEDTADLFLRTQNKIIILALAYQDGLQDALMRIKDNRSSGEYYNAARVDSLIRNYEAKIKFYRDADNYWDACYCRGYQNGLISLAASCEVHPPSVEVLFNDNVNTVPKLARLAKKRIPKCVMDDVTRVYQRLETGDLIPEHMPYV